MTNPRSKSETLSETTKSYLQEWLKTQIYQRSKDIKSKYLDKGNICEQDALDFIADELDYGLLIKNEELFENEYMKGTPDVVLNDEIIDVKNSWDCFTFPLFETELPNKNYYWQLQGYMALTDKQSAKLIYTLMDTPNNIIEREAYYYCKSNGYGDLDDDILKQFTDKMTYNTIESKYRIKVFEVERNDDDIAKIQERVKECRNYLKSII